MSPYLPGWFLAPLEPAQVENLCRKMGILPAVARVLLNRGLTGEKEAEQFLHPGPDQLLPPAKMLGMREAVRRICRALEQGEKIVIYGDYDADGVTSTAILMEVLGKLGGSVNFFLPNRTEGYGLHREILQRIKEEGASLVITVDCGITAREEARYAQQIGLDLIITDHHQPQEPLPETTALLNPLREGCPYPFKWLSGAGVAFKLASALLEEVKAGSPFSLLDLAAVGTVADMVPLLGENRVLVSLGLAEINCSPRVGLKALAEAAGLPKGKIGSTALAFGIAPALNAAGRMGQADPAVHLLLEQDPGRAGELARYLYHQNQLRRDTEAKILLEAETLLAGDPRLGEKVITLAGEGWHPGVIGIVASRLVERFYRPVVIITVVEGVGCGSARSIPGFNIGAALQECAVLLERFGGHEQAAGLTVDPGNIKKLGEELNRIADRCLAPEDLIPRCYIEAELSADEINYELAEQLTRLEPFGMANPLPVFGSCSWELRSWRLVGSEGKHLKLNFSKENRSLKPILFSGASLVPGLSRYRKLDLAFNLKAGTFREQPVLNVELKDIGYCDSSFSGRLEIIDRRGEPERLNYIRELTRGCGRAVVFAGTLHRQKMLQRHLPGEILFMTSGLGNREQDPKQVCGQLVLYDLPLHFRLLAPFFKGHKKFPKVRVHLLYSDSNRKMNEQLTAMTLPSKQALQQIYRALLESAAGEEVIFPGALKDRLSYPERYWRRCRDILIETGLLAAGQDGRFTLITCQQGWTEKLELSATYRSTQKLAEECRRFQELLLEGNRQELADYFGLQLEYFSENCGQ